MLSGLETAVLRRRREAELEVAKMENVELLSGSDQDG